MSRYSNHYSLESIRWNIFLDGQQFEMTSTHFQEVLRWDDIVIEVCMQFINGIYTYQATMIWNIYLRITIISRPSVGVYPNKDPRGENSMTILM